VVITVIIATGRGKGVGGGVRSRFRGRNRPQPQCGAIVQGQGQIPCQGVGEWGQPSRHRVLTFPPVPLLSAIRDSPYRPGGGPIEPARLQDDSSSLKPTALRAMDFGLWW
jgi:hypothetical protein